MRKTVLGISLVVLVVGSMSIYATKFKSNNETDSSSVVSLDETKEAINISQKDEAIDDKSRADHLYNIYY